MEYLLYFILGILVFIYLVKYFFSSLGFLFRISWDLLKLVAKVIAIGLLIWGALSILS